MKSSNILQFNDFKYIELIRKRLWYGQEFGRAALMVGSGFSRNADQISEKTPKFPLWTDLGGIFFQSLYPKFSLSEDEYQKLEKQVLEEKTIDQLAQNYENNFGRAALDDLLINSIPDNKYKPGYLHKLLLSLAWSDVFTTNYDTLLERTLPKIVDRKYDLVLTGDDLPQKQKPRLVKLHGSFPSHRPFIITENDYEGYPDHFAPFTNMVQEAIMENIFCLIGFSSNDKNFRKWSDWVNFNLKKSMHQIYLCGILDLSESQKKDLPKNVIPIDFAPLFPKTSWPDPDLRYKCALEWFLLTLMEGAPPNKNQWPIPYKTTRTSKCPYIPSIPPGPPSFPDLGKMILHFDSLSSQEILDINSKWRLQREEYPGWLVLPVDNRETILNYTKNWVNPILKSLDRVDPPNDIFVLFELNWRIQLLAFPLFSNWIPFFEKIVAAYNPFPEIYKTEEPVIQPNLEKFKDFDWKLISKCWIDIVFSLAREARRDHNEVTFRKWMTILKNIVKQKDEWLLTWYSEYSQYYLNILDQESLKNNLKLWPKSATSPFFDVKKAALLAELGEFDEATKITETALDEIRTQLLSNHLDYWLLSREAWTMVLYQNLTLMKNVHDGVNPVENRNRWERLAVYRCNPWPEIEKLQSLMQTTKLDSSRESKKTWSFDPGRVTISHHFNMSSNVEDIFPCLSFLQLFEQAALPMSCGNVNIFSSDVILASKKTMQLYPISGIIWMIRTGKDEEVKEWFNRPRIAAMPTNQINYLSNLLLRSFDQSLNHLLKCRLSNKYNEPDFSYNIFEPISEILSRLCFRFSNEQISELFNYSVQMYNSPFFYKDRKLFNCVGRLFKRTLNNMPESMLIEKIPILLNLPIPTENGYNPAYIEHWVEPTLLLSLKENIKLSRDFDRSKWETQIINLIRIVKEGAPEGRKRAIARLEMINEIEGFTEVTRKMYASALWNRKDSLSNLPSDIPYRKFFVLFMPEVEKGIGKTNFRGYITQQGIPLVIKREKREDGKVARSTGGIEEFLEFTFNWKGSTLSIFSNSTTHSDALIDWTENELISLFKKINTRWNEEKSDFKKESGEKYFATSFFEDNMETQISELISLIGVVILPKITIIKDTSCQKEIIDLINDMEESGACVLAILPLTLLVDQNKLDRISHKMRMGILSLKEIDAESAISGVYHWFQFAQKNLIPPVPRDIITELINKVVTRRQPGLFDAIYTVNEIIEHDSHFLDDVQIRSALCEALEYLFKDSELPRDLTTEKREQNTSNIPLKGLPHYRELSAILAFNLFKYFELKRISPPKILLQWQEVCQADILPEVRNAWK